MPSPRHDTINQLFRDRPAFAVEILRELIGVKISISGPVWVESNDFNDRPSKDFQPDTVITVGPPNASTHGIIVEVQQDKSPAKLRQLPRYAAALWLMLRCPVTVLCVCPDTEVAARYAEPISTELPGYVFRAAVLGPDRIPVIRDEKEIAARPELAAMSVMVHGRNREVVEAFVRALKPAKLEHAPQYYEYAYLMATPAIRRILEEIMSSSPWPVYSPFAREHFGRGKAEGLAEGEALTILKVLAARQIEVPDDVRARIRGCADQRQLDTWLDRAIVATSVNDLFD
jgi:hypothetical protein